MFSTFNHRLERPRFVNPRSYRSVHAESFSRLLPSGAMGSRVGLPIVTGRRTATKKARVEDERPRAFAFTLLTLN
jgi:hypothetical protein